MTDIQIVIPVNTSNSNIEDKRISIARNFYNLKNRLQYSNDIIDDLESGINTKIYYVESPFILANNNFDPYIDLKRDKHMLYQLSGNNYKLRDDLRKYFLNRQEDSIDLKNIIKEVNTR